MATSNIVVSVPTVEGTTGAAVDVSALTGIGRTLFIVLAAKSDYLTIEASPDNSRWFPVKEVRGGAVLSVVERLPVDVSGAPLAIVWLRVKRLRGTGAVTLSIAGEVTSAPAARFRRDLVSVRLPADADPADDITREVIYSADGACKVTGVVMLPAAALTANNTNNKTTKIYRRDASGGSEALVASLVTDVTTGSWVAFVSKSFGALSNVDLAAGESLLIEQTHAGTGATAPKRTVQVTVEIAA